MKMFVPSIGTKLVLTKDWTFDLWSEYRNDSLHRALGLDFKSRYSYPLTSQVVNLSAGTLLTVDRIYIRKNLDGFDSMTFNMPDPEKVYGKGRKRFWAKLTDVHTMEFDLVQD